MVMEEAEAANGDRKLGKSCLTVREVVSNIKSTSRDTEQCTVPCISIVVSVHYRTRLRLHYANKVRKEARGLIDAKIDVAGLRVRV